ncbi:MAG: CDP-alcohol phosphatidyltransferase family protein [Alphaproteobacteria bacterium]
MSPQKSRLHYFGADEEEYFDRIADRRTKLFRPVAMWFVRRNVRSDTLSLTSFMLIPLFFFPLFGLRLYVPAWIVLIMSLCLDGLDGPVARLGRYASDKGALSDILNDITGMVFVAVTAVYFGFAHPTLCMLYVVTYLYMIVFIIARNVMEMPFKVVIKSKYWLYVFLLVKVHWEVDILNWFLFGFSMYQAVMATLGFIMLRRHLPGVLGAGTRGAWPHIDKVALRQRRLERRLARKERRLRKRMEGQS